MTAEAVYLRDHVLEQLELANIDDDVDRIRARRTIVVVGASYSGTELVAQLRALADAAAEQMGFDPSAVNFVLLDLADQVMPEVGEKLGDGAMRVLRQRGIDVRLGMTLKEVHPDHVVLSDDSWIDTRTVAWVTGVTGAPLIEKLGLPTERGRLKVQADLQVPGHPDVFAAGDAAAVPDLTQPGKITPPTAQHAIRQGKVLARNIAASMEFGRPRTTGIETWAGRRSRTPLRSRQSAEHTSVWLPRKVCDSHVPPVRHPALRQSLGGVAGVSDRRVLRPIRRLGWAVHPGRRPVLHQRGDSAPEGGLTTRPR